MILDLFRKEIEFNNIHGYDDIKDIVRRALDAEDNYNLLFIGLILQSLLCHQVIVAHLHDKVCQLASVP